VKVDFGDAKSIVKLECVTEKTSSSFLGKTMEGQVAKALKITLGNHTKAGQLLGISQSAVSQRVAKSKFLQKIIMQTGEQFVDKAESIVLKKLKENNFDAALVVIQRLGWMRGWVKREELAIDAPRGGGILLLPQPYPLIEEGIKAWERDAQLQQNKLLGYGEEGEDYDREEDYREDFDGLSDAPGNSRDEDVEDYDESQSEISTDKEDH
jgi:hypothetical protein